MSNTSLSTFDISSQYFPSALQQFQYFDKYSRFDWDKDRRETWVETVDRAINYLKELSQNKLSPTDYERLRNGLLEMKATPSMRLLAMAGKAAHRHNQAIYNCSYLPIDSLDAWPEVMIISMCGCGVGFSVEKQYVDKLPVIKKQVGLNGSTPVMYIEDSMEGWAEAIRKGVYAWFEGLDIKFDYSKLRPAGTPLKTKGGHSSGPRVLQETLDFIKQRILSKQEQKLTTLDAHDITCKIGDASISGGVRRCMAKGTKVHTRRGLINIEDVVVGDLAMTDIGYKKVVESVNQGVQDSVKIKTETGMDIICTPDHRVAVLSSAKGDYIFKQAQELMSGDRLLFINNAIDGELHPLPELGDFKEADTIRTNIQNPPNTPDTYWILGMLHANGYVYTDSKDPTRVSVSFSNNINKEDVNKKIIAWFRSIGIEPRVSSPGDEKVVIIKTGNRQISRWFSLFKEPKTEITIPDQIVKGSIETRAAYISGVIDGDGSVGGRPLMVASTVYPEYAKQLIRLLASLGIVSELHEKPRKEEGWKTIWNITIKDFNSKLKFEELTRKFRCLDIPERLGKQRGYTIPQKFILRDLDRNIWSKKYFPRGELGLNSSTFSNLTGIDFFTPVKVVSVEQNKEVETFDLSIEDQHVFVAEGYLVHNTAMISLFDFNDDLMLNCKSGDFERDNIQRYNANNSIVWPDRKLTREEVEFFMRVMIDSGRGEPGIFNRRSANLMKPDRRKEAVYGTNPCFHKDTLIETIYGKKKISEITEPTYVYSMDEFGKLCIQKASASWKTRENAETLKVTIANGKSLTVTPNHKIMVAGKGWIEVKDVKVKDRVVALSRQRRGAKYSGVKLTSEGLRDYRMEHRFIWEGVNGSIPEGYDINHIDTDTYNNRIDNLELLTHSEHATLTRYQVANNHQVKDSETGRWISGPDSKKGEKQIVSLPEELKTGLHQYPTVVSIEVGETVDVYDISVENTHCLIAEGIVAHNCGEINLRPYEFCNLTIAIARENDTEETLKEKVELATILGTIQSMATSFPGLRDIWRQNCEEERLLGVDITGEMDCPLIIHDDGSLLQRLRDHAVAVNKKYAEILGIPQSAAITCNKPSGNSSQLFNSASGIHARFAPYYIRRVRVNANSPMRYVLEANGMPLIPDRGKSYLDADIFVAEFPVKSPDGAVTRHDQTITDQLSHWLKNKKFWTEHNPSCTISYKPDEVEEMIEWVYVNQNFIGGLSFLPFSDANYPLMPYEEINEAKYKELVAEFPKIDFSLITKFEHTDMTEAAQLIACMGGACEIPDFHNKEMKFATIST